MHVQFYEIDMVGESVTAILNACNEVDNKENVANHTGKVVIDNLDDCKNLLSYKDETTTRLRFYRFDPKKAIKKSNKPNNDGFVKVANRGYNKNKSRV